MTKVTLLRFHHVMNVTSSSGIPVNWISTMLVSFDIIWIHSHIVPVFTKCCIGIFIKIEILAPKDYKCERLQSLNIIKLINQKNQNGDKACTDVSTETSNCQFDEVTYP